MVAQTQMTGRWPYLTRRYHCFEAETEPRQAAALRVHCRKHWHFYFGDACYDDPRNAGGDGLKTIFFCLFLLLQWKQFQRKEQDFLLCQPSIESPLKRGQSPKRPNNKQRNNRN